MFEMKFKDAVQGAKLATKLVTAVTILGLATGCVSEQVRNDDPSQDLPALVLNDESTDGAIADSSGSLSASPEASEDSAGDLSLDESQPTLGVADGSLADSQPTSSSADLSYTPPELPPLAAEPSPSKKIAKKSSKKSKKVASKKSKSSKVAKNETKHSKKKAKKIAKKAKKQEVATAAVVASNDVLPPAPPAPPVDGITLDGASDSGATSAAADSSAVAMDNSSGMNLPADPSAIGSQETTTIEPPLVLSQSPDIAASSEGSFMWICFAAGMVVLAGLVFFKMKRRREVSRY
jgi:hypothetical protein